MNMVYDIMDMKFLKKVAANRLNPFVVIKTKRKKNSTTFPHILASRA